MGPAQVRSTERTRRRRSPLITVVGVLVEFCPAHLLRDVKYLTTLNGRTRKCGGWVLTALKKLFGVFHRREKMTPEGQEAALERLRARHGEAGTGGPEAKRLEKEIADQEDFVAELEDFEEKLRPVAELELEPDLDDGVVLNIAPLRELVP